MKRQRQRLCFLKLSLLTQALVTVHLLSWLEIDENAAPDDPFFNFSETTNIYEHGRLYYNICMGEKAGIAEGRYRMDLMTNIWN